MDPQKPKSKTAQAAFKDRGTMDLNTWQELAKYDNLYDIPFDWISRIHKETGYSYDRLSDLAEKQVMSKYIES